MPRPFAAARIALALAALAASVPAGCASTQRTAPQLPSAQSPPSSATMPPVNPVPNGNPVPDGNRVAPSAAAQAAGALPTLPNASPLQTSSRRVAPDSSPSAAEMSDAAVSQIAFQEPPPAGEELLHGALPFSLEQAISASLAQNPDLVAIRGTVPVSRAALGVARVNPFNSFLQIQATPFEHAPSATVGANPGIYNYVLFMKTFEIAHQGRYRERAGTSDLERVRWTVRQAELLNVAMTQQLFFTALYQRGLRDLARSAADSNAELASTLERQLDEGNATAADVAVSRLDRQSTERQFQLADANYQTALLSLRRQLNLPSATEFTLAGDLTAWRFLPATDSIPIQGPAGSAPQPLSKSIEELAAARPDVMAARSDVATAQANVRLANASRVPNMQIGPYYQRDDFATTYYGFRSHFEVPQNNGRPQVRQREAELGQRQLTFRQLEQRARLEAEAAFDRYERARRLIEQIDGDGIDAPDELRRLEELFRQGEIEVQRIVLARNSMLQVRRSQLDALNEAAQAAAAVTAATGLPPTALIAPKRP